VELGVFLPVSGRAAGPDVLTDAAQSAERQGWDAVWSADRVVTPWKIATEYPYAEDAAFIVPPDRPFLDSMTCLAYLAGRTERIRLGISVLVLPYRHPLYWSRVAASVDLLAGGRLIMGVGVGWMREEFEAQNVPFEARGRLTDEQLEIVARLMSEDSISYEGEHYRFHDLSFVPKRRLPIWVGGEGKAARRRSARYGDAWFPYYVRVSPDELRRRHEEVRRMASEFGRDPDSVALTACAAVQLTPEPVAQEPDRLRGTPEQVVEAIQEYERAGVEHLALQFMVPHYPERLVQIERFATAVLPRLAGKHAPR
jgi:probable F420-dependent oxidoreductase